MGDRWNGFILLWLLFLLPGLSLAARHEVPVAVVTGGDAVMFDGMIEELAGELAALSGPELKLSLPAAKIHPGLWSEEGIHRALEQAQQDPESEIVLTMGYVASSVASRGGVWTKPVLASQPLLPPEGETEGLRWLAVGSDIQAGIRLFLNALKPASVVLIVDAQAAVVLPEIDRFARVFLKGEGDPEFRVVLADATPEAIVKAAGERAGCVILAPFPSLTSSDMTQVAEAFSKKSIPTCTLGGLGDVESGILFSVQGENASRKLARRTALALYAMARGEAPVSSVSGSSGAMRPVINLVTARAVGFSPDWQLIRYAVTVGGPERVALPLSLSDAISRARKLNGAIRSEALSVEASAQDVKKALSYLAPRISSSITGVRLDENSAKKSMGRESEESIKASLTLIQVLYSEKAISGYSAVKKLQKSREEGLEASRRDLALSVAEGYIGVLKAKGVARVQEGNLALTVENLERARSRKRAGAINPSELYRWESEVAMNRTALLKARSGVVFAENALKRLCGIPFSDDVVLVGDIEPALLSFRPWFQAMTASPTHFDALTVALVSEGLESSPELAALESALASGRRRIKGVKRTFYLPEVALQGKVTEVVDRHGFDEVLPPFDEREWQIAVQVSLPLVKGGERLADLRKVSRETAALDWKRRHARVTLEEGIRDAAIAVQVAEAARELAQISREAAEKNLALVTDAYVEGALPVIRLLDAQNTAVNARIAAENAVHDHMLALVKLQRFVGGVDLTGADGDALVARLKQIVEEGGDR